MAISIKGRKQKRTMIDFYILLVVDIAKSMIIKTKLLEVEKNNFLGEVHLEVA